eukprot:365441-Chlamydomonas_euryale.AAC.17
MQMSAAPCLHSRADGCQEPQSPDAAAVRADGGTRATPGVDAPANGHCGRAAISARQGRALLPGGCGVRGVNAGHGAQWRCCERRAERTLLKPPSSLMCVPQDNTHAPAARV